MRKMRVLTSKKCGGLVNLACTYEHRDADFRSDCSSLETCLTIQDQNYRSLGPLRRFALNCCRDLKITYALPTYYLIRCRPG